MTKTDEEEKIGFVDKIDRAFSVLGILVAAEDELFERIQLVPGIKKYERLIVGTGWLCSIMGAFFLLMGIVAHFFYVNKNALGLLGLVSALHVSIGPASYFGIRKKNRRVLFIVTSLNASWICLATLLTIYCVTLMGQYFQSNSLVDYMVNSFLPLAIFEAFANLMLVKSLVIMKEDKTKTSGQAGPKEGMKEEKSWENSLSTNSSSKSSSISKSVSGTSKSKKTTSKKVTTKKQVKDNNLKSNSKSISHLKK